MEWNIISPQHYDYKRVRNVLQETWRTIPEENIERRINVVILSIDFQVC